MVGGCRGYVVSGCRGYVVAGLTENKTKPSSWGLAELSNCYHMFCVSSNGSLKIGKLMFNKSDGGNRFEIW